MKKLLVSALVLGMIVMSGCAGDDPEGPEGTLPIVQDLAIGAASAGNSIVLTWSAVEDVDGYTVYFRETASGSWTEVGDVATTTFTHVASAAGYYTVMAYEGEDTSEGYATEVNTLPNVITTVYTIYDRWSPADKPSAFQFGANGGQTGMAGSSFEKDIYAWDEQTDGDTIVRLYSGTYGPYAGGSSYGGNPTYMADPDGTYGYCSEYGTGSWYENYPLYESDSAVFCALPFSGGDVIYVKMFDLNIAPDPDSNRGTMVSFQYEYQPLANITVFTSNY